jgi:TPR repeat protein
LVLHNFGGTPRPDLAEAVERIRRAAENGYPDAQFELGRALEDGQGLARNASEAALWYRKAAEQGHAAAQSALARLTESGTAGGPPNPAEALKWFRLAAEQDFAEAQYRIGRLYATGTAGVQHFGEAAIWYRRAAGQGHAPAQVGLGSLYFLGLGVLQDYVQAHMWLNLATSKLAPGKELDRALELRNRIARMLRPADLIEAQRMARAWQTKKENSTKSGADPAMLAGLDDLDSAGD